MTVKKKERRIRLEREMNPPRFRLPQGLLSIILYTWRARKKMTMAKTFAKRAAWKAMTTGAWGRCTPLHQMKTQM